LEHDTVHIQTDWHKLSQVVSHLKKEWLDILSYRGEYLPNNTVELTEFDKALKVHTLIETLEEDEDVESVWHNASFPANIQAEILTHLESQRFRT
jgi:transcriptional/translational regulatory protein YebC/TACO1